MKHAFKFHYDEKLQNHYVSLKFGVENEKGKATYFKDTLVIDHPFKDAEKEKLAYWCKLKFANKNRSEKITFEFGEISDNLKNAGIKQYIINVGDEKLKVNTAEILDEVIINSLITFLTNQCNDYGKDAEDKPENQEEQEQPEEQKEPESYTKHKL